MTTKPQLLDIPEDDYHMLPGLTSTKLRTYVDDPGEFHWKYILGKGWDDKPGRSLDVGKAFHLALLEPGLLHEKTVVSPHDSYRTKAAKAWRAETEASGVLILTLSEMAMIENMRLACTKHPVWTSAHPGGMAEKSVIFDFLGERCRARLDYCRPDLDLVIDVKTTTDSSPKGFRQSVRKYGYHIQAYLYSEAYQAVYDRWPRFIFLAVGKGARHPVAMYELSDASMEHAQKQTEAAVRGIRDKVWTSPWETEVQELEIY